MTSKIKTMLLLAALSAIIICIGGLIGGRGGIIIAFVLALAMNVFSYWYSDSIVLKMYSAREVSPAEAPALHQIVEELAANAGIPKPKVCVVPEQAPNAFATGRDPEHAVVACTEGILRVLDQRELRGVLAHEIAHIAHRDILIQTVASVLGSTIVTLANMLQFTAMFGGRDSERTSPLAAILLAILAPLAATLIQMAISRSREYLADEGGAEFSRDPLALANALNKLQTASQQIPMQQGNASTASLFIVSPLFGGKMENLFSTHPPMEDRISRLQQMAGRCSQGAGQSYPQNASSGSASQGGSNHFGDL